MYLAVSETTISSVLVLEEDEKQLPIYYVSKALLDAETRYSQLEKLALSLVSAARKLRPYFQSHSVVVMTSFPLKQILHKPELSGPLTKWGVELSKYDISFAPCTTIKSQVLAQRELLCLMDGPATGIWMLQVDGWSNINGTGLGIILTSLEGDQIEQAIRREFKATNNETEYEVLITGLVLAKEIGITRIHVCSDSQLIVNQIQGTFLAKDTKITSYLELVKRLCKEFDEFLIIQVPRTEKIQVDALASLKAITNTKQSKVIPIVYLQWPAVQKFDENNSIHSFEEQSWMTPIIKYLQNDELPPDKNKARRNKAKVARFYIIDDKLYRRSFSRPYLRCISNAEVEYILAELHEGECGNHLGAPEPGASCQRFANVSHLPPERLNPVLSPWPFIKWGMDIIGKLPSAPGQRVFVLAIIDYFTKWIEAKALSKIHDRKVIQFIWKNVICRFGVPKEIVTDNRTQFISTGFQNFCKEWNIKLNFSTSRYSQANGQAESSNKTVMTLKKRLSEAKGKWANELPRSFGPIAPPFEHPLVKHPSR
ncbi:uncharacterized protein LOC111376864 [Olea europaea var. sylvestris]|uniref:uncharacterized protein LOC111376864 n=1 Tax=Olea europaea var. sylvestris TaxID=158386 RepID=UPI000C1D236D|nr:uncharacterized protein LOC111376864 [Olea europaea var. sylvestris]